MACFRKFLKKLLSCICSSQLFFYADLTVFSIAKMQIKLVLLFIINSVMFENSRACGTAPSKLDIKSIFDIGNGLDIQIVPNSEEVTADLKSDLVTLATVELKN